MASVSIFKTAQTTDGSAAKTNMVYFNPADAKALESAPGKTVAPGKAYVEINKMVFSFQYVIFQAIFR
jgi:hypothetical protein